MENIVACINFNPREDESDLNSGDDEEDHDEEEPVVDKFPDMGYLFGRSPIFHSRAGAEDWARETATKNRIVLVVARSDEKSVWLDCQRHGKRRERKGRDLPLKNVKTRLTTSKRCGCLFRIKCLQVISNRWVVRVAHGVHNHPLAKYL